MKTKTRKVRKGGLPNFPNVHKYTTAKSIPESPLSFKTPKSIPESPLSFKTPKPIETPLSFKTPKPIETPLSFKTPKPIETHLSFKTPKPIETPLSFKTPKPIETHLSFKTAKSILNEKNPSLNTKSKSFTSYFKNIGSNITAKVKPVLSKIATHAKNLTAKVKPALATPSKTLSKKSFSLNKQRENAVNWAIKNKLIEKTVPSPVSPPPPTSKSNIPPHVQKAINTIVHYISNVSNSKLDTIQSPFLAVQKQASSMARK
jgi:hypothetical protein